MRRTHGFTLIELIIAMGLTAVVVAFLLFTFSDQHKTYQVVDQVTEAQQNARAAAGLIEHDLREAGYMVPPGAAVCAWDNTNSPDTLFVSDADAILDVSALQNLGIPTTTDFSVQPVPLGPNWETSGSVPATGVNLQLSQDYLDVSGTPDFASKAGVIVLDEQTGKSACGIITNEASPTNLTVNFGMTRIGPLGTLPEVAIVPAHVYQIVTPTAGGPSVLERDGVPLVADAEDFQVAVFLDANGNGIVDSGEYEGAGGGAPVYAPSSVDNRTLREVRFDLVVTTRDPDPNRNYQSGVGQATENRNPTTVPGKDGFRRRVFTAAVRPRNEGL